MTILVVGASGATGRLVVEQLLHGGKRVKIIVRDKTNLSDFAQKHPQLTVIKANILAINDEQLAQIVQGCSAVICTLGHNLSFAGMFAPPRALVTDATQKLCEAIISHKANNRVKFILMNSSGVRNLDLDEKISNAQKAVIFTLRHLLPPHRDNEQAAAYLRTTIGTHHPLLTWVSIRPDALVDHLQESDYKMHPSPTRSAIFDSGICSRINVASAMRDLVCDELLWEKWQGRMPVLYNSTQA
ncbi:MAG: SDR family oxidoreductase [Oceanospirillaceae bacterium]|nr:SDR family oxidoreductase [Oceanospirillaceae bacterium]